MSLQQTLSSNEQKSTSSLVFAIILGAIGAAINLFPIQLAFSISLLLGNVVYIIAASTLRPAHVVLCALICVTPMYFYWGHPYGFLTFGLEALFVSMLRARGWFIITADLLYWLVIGMPLTALLIWINLEPVQSIIIFGSIKQALNAVLYTSLACILLFSLHGYLKRFSAYQPRLEKTLPSWLLYSYLSISGFLVISLSLVLTTGIEKFEHKQLERELSISNEYVAYISQTYIEEHQRAISNIAFQLSKLPDLQAQQSVLAQAHKLYPGFLTMIIADKQGMINNASPVELLSTLKKTERSVADRDYFTAAINEQSVYVSPVFLGRGFGMDAIVAISAPIYSAGTDAKPTGIVEGSLNVSMLGKYDVNGLDKKLIVTDQYNHVIYASDGLGLVPLSKYQFIDGSRRGFTNLLRIVLPDGNSERFLYKKASLPNGWQVYSLIEHSVLLKITENMYTIMFIMLFIILLVASFFAKQFANYLHRPLAFVMEELSKPRDRDDFQEIPYETPVEIDQLYHELKIRSRALLNHKAHLQELVEQRTEELNQANLKLTEQAHKDMLTSLYNRRYFDKHFVMMQSILSRSSASLMCVMVDIDHFKRINDSYGHLAGDACLIETARILASFFTRDTDVVARFGGEEFVVISPCRNNLMAEQHLESFREHVAATVFKQQDNTEIKLTVSIGAVVGDANFSTSQNVWLEAADKCLYQAKSSGRNNTKFQTLKLKKERIAIA